MNDKRPPFSYLIMGIISVFLAIIFYAGLVFGDDLNGRMIVGSVWFAMGLVWVFRFYNIKRRLEKKSER